MQNINQNWISINDYLIEKESPKRNNVTLFGPWQLWFDEKRCGEIWLQKNRQNTTIVHYLAVDNFDLTRKVAEIGLKSILVCLTAEWKLRILNLPPPVSAKSVTELEKVVLQCSEQQKLRQKYPQLLFQTSNFSISFAKIFLQKQTTLCLRNPILRFNWFLT